MRKVLLIIILLITVVFSAVMIRANDAFAATCEGVETAIIECGNGSGEGVAHILRLVVDIMTIGIGILGVIGITVVGIQYLTAGGSEEKTRKAKRRMFEIVIGLVAYVLSYAVLRWLLPNFN